MQAPTLHRCHQQHFWLSPHRTIFWEENSTLILSDPHLGKTGHFRKAGIPVPAELFIEDLQRMFSVIQHYQPKTLLITGDFFHSKHNIELSLFGKWRDSIKHVEIVLIKGNHDILSDEWYATHEIECLPFWLKAPFCFVHDLKDIKGANGTSLYPITGHIHPGIKLNGSAKQSIMLPCFYFGLEFAILPAYSRFTGLTNLKGKMGDQVYAIAENRVILCS